MVCAKDPRQPKVKRPVSAWRKGPNRLTDARERLDLKREMPPSEARFHVETCNIATVVPNPPVSIATENNRPIPIWLTLITPTVICPILRLNYVRGRKCWGKELYQS